MTSFPTDRVPVTLTGEQWTAILCKLAKPQDGLSSHGRAVYREAANLLAEQLQRASEAAARRELIVEGKWPFDDLTGVRFDEAEVMTLMTGESRRKSRSDDAASATILILQPKPRAE